MKDRPLTPQDGSRDGAEKAPGRSTKPETTDNWFKRLQAVLDEAEADDMLRPNFWRPG